MINPPLSRHLEFLMHRRGGQIGHTEQFTFAPPGDLIHVHRHRFQIERREDIAIIIKPDIRGFGNACRP